jgi:glycosidase
MAGRWARLFGVVLAACASTLSCAAERPRPCAVARDSPTVRAPPIARARARVSGSRVVLDGTASAGAPGRRLARYAWSESPAVNGDASAAAVGEGPRLEVALPTRAALVEGRRYRLRITGDAGAQDEASVVVEVDRDGAPTVIDEEHGEPAWIAGAVVYGVVPTLYGRPPLRAVRRALPELAALGVTALWLAPVFESPPGDYGYAVTDPTRVRAALGDREELALLDREAHAAGLRVLLDWVPNHSSDQSPWFLDAQARGRASPFFGFYDRDASGRPTHYFDWAKLPNLDYQNPLLATRMTDAATAWLGDADVDGFRVDAAWGVARRSPAYWPRFRAEVRRKKPDALLLAEASAREPYWLAGTFDAAYDWPAGADELGHDAWAHVFDEGPGVARRLADAVAASGASVRQERIFRALEHNDSGDRFVTRHGEAMTRVAAAALLTLPGIPCLFTGQEAGVAYRPYEANGPLERATQAHPGLRDRYAALIALRRGTPALTARGFAPLLIDEAREIYAYARFDDAHRSVAIVALGFSARAVEITLTLPASLRVDAAAGSLAWRSRLDGAGEPLLRARDGALTFTVPPFGARVLVRE